MAWSIVDPTQGDVSTARARHRRHRRSSKLRETVAGQPDRPMLADLVVVTLGR